MNTDICSSADVSFMVLARGDALVTTNAVV